MQNPNDVFTFEPDIHYVVHYNAALNFPEFFDPNADLPERHIIISRIYQKSLHNMRDENSDRGIAANELAQLLYDVITRGKKSRNDGALEYHLGKLHVIFDYQDHVYRDKPISGEHIKETIALAKYWSTQGTVQKVQILTNDPLMQISALDHPELDIHMFSPAPYCGYRHIKDDETVSYWRKAKQMPISTWHELQPEAEPLKPHEFVLFGKTNTFSHIGRYDAFKECIVPLSYYKNLRGITPIGELQVMAFEALMAPADEIGVVILYGNAGAGKSFATVAAALAQSGFANTKTFDSLSNDNNGKNARSGRKRKNQCNGDAIDELAYCSNDDYTYPSILYCPPDRMLGDKMAAVPGDERAKLAGKLQALFDSICAYLRIRGDKKEGGFALTERDIYMRANSIMDKIDLCPPGEINGRSLWNTFFICDEAQFNTLSQIKAFIERCDCGTKLALCGDPSQISNPFGWHGNPLARAVRYLGSDPNVAVIRFDGESDIMRPGAQIIARSWPR